MSGKKFTSETAPRQGSVPGRKPRLSRQAMVILDRLMVDWTKHGAAVLRTLQIERPELYAKLALDVASRVVLTMRWRQRAVAIGRALGYPRPSTPYPGAATTNSRILADRSDFASAAAWPDDDARSSSEAVDPVAAAAGLKVSGRKSGAGIVQLDRGLGESDGQSCRAAGVGGLAETLSLCRVPNMPISSVVGG